ncbi:hypothetical protein SGLAM104S_06348 [Streptomyces glaucescens]
MPGDGEKARAAGAKPCAMRVDASGRTRPASGCSWSGAATDHRRRDRGPRPGSGGAPSAATSTSKEDVVFPDHERCLADMEAFLGRAGEDLVEEAGIRQFLDIGTGLPTADNTHEVAQRLAPQTRIVYVDNDPLVLAHARALSPAPPRAAPTTWTRTCAMSTRSSNTPPRRWTSASRWR